MNAYQSILNVVKLRGVDRIFGVPGDAINPLIEAIRNDNDVQFVHVAHEESGAFAASAAAKLSNELQVCASTVGPGSIHLLNGLYDAKLDHAPVLALVGQVATEFIGTDYHQEVNLPRLFSDVADYLVEVRNPEQLPHIVLEACNHALTHRSVSVLVLPHDIATKDVPDVTVNEHQQTQPAQLSPAPALLARMRELIRKAQRPCLFIGDGARNCGNQLIPLAEHLGAPIIHSLRGRDILPLDSPWVAGGLGLLGSRGGVAAMKDCDLLLLLGSDFPYRSWITQDVTIIQVDRRPEVLGRRCPGALGVAGDCRHTVTWLLANVPDKAHDTSYLDGVRKSRDLWDKLMDQQESLDRSDDLIHPQGVVRAISDRADENAIFTCDTGEVTVWGARHLHLKRDQRFSLSFNLASMAYAMPAAIGAKIKYPDRQVISISGDGGFNMLMGDLLTAVKYQLPIKVFVMNNGKLGLIKMEQEAEGYPESETDLQNPDYAQLAEAMGARGLQVARPGDVEAAVGEALGHDGPTLVDVRVNGDEITWPPKIEMGQAIGFGLAKFRELLCCD